MKELEARMGSLDSLGMLLQYRRAVFGRIYPAGLKLAKNACAYQLSELFGVFQLRGEGFTP